MSEEELTADLVRSWGAVSACARSRGHSAAPAQTPDSLACTQVAEEVPAASPEPEPEPEPQPQPQPEPDARGSSSSAGSENGDGGGQEDILPGVPGTG